MSLSLKRLFGHSVVLVACFFVAILPAWPGEGRTPQKNTGVGRLVVVGDSLSAGFQNFSLYDSDSVAPPGGQTHGFAELIAHQANVSLNLPLIQYPGIPPALVLEGQQITRAPGFGTREPQTLPVQTLNLSVPGFDVVDSLVHKVNASEVQKNPQAASFEDLLAVEILGYPSLFEKPSSRCGVFALPNGEVLFSEAACAIKLRPNTILISIGNGDALQSLTLGIPPTDVAHFSRYYQILLDALSHYTRAKIVVSNIPNVTDLPFLVSYPEFEARCGVPPAGAGPNDYVVPNLANPIFDICTNYAVRTAALIAQAQTAVHDYNLIIAATAAKSHGVVVDVNTLFARLANYGYKIGEHQLTTQYLGGIFSLDAVHPSNTGYAILANAFIDRMNCELHTNIPPLNIEQIADADPLVLSNPGK